MKKLIAVVLTVILLTAVLLPVGAASGPTSGQCGDNVYWSLSDGVLNIYGSGDMYGFSISNALWSSYSYRGIQSVTVQEGVTSIGAYAFYNCSAQYISLPSTIKSIGNHAFYSCEFIREIYLPEGIKAIPENAFSCCDNLSLVTIPRSLESFGIYAFYRCCSLKSIVIPKGITKIPSWTFEDCSSLRWVSIPKSVNLIDFSAFHGCDSLSDVYYEGSSSQYSNIDIESIDSYNEGLKYAQRHYDTYRSFLDVPTDEWYYKPVEYVSENSIMTGTKVNVFSPASALNRAQFAVVLYRLEGSPSVSYAPRFFDIQNGTWFTDAVIWASNVGIVKGYTNGYYGFADNITREQITLMMHRYANYKNKKASGYVDISKFPDAYRVSDYAVDAFEWAYGNQIVTGKNNGTILDPLGFTTRCECATIIQRFMGYIDKVSKTITIGIPTSPSVYDYDFNSYTSWIEQQCDCEIEFMYFSSNQNDAKTQLATMIAWDEPLPDIIGGISLGSYVSTEYGEDGYFINLKPYLENTTASKPYWDRFSSYVPSAMRSTYKTQILNSTDYAFPEFSYSSQSGLSVINEAYISSDCTNKDLAWKILVNMFSKEGTNMFKAW